MGRNLLARSSLLGVATGLSLGLGFAPALLAAVPTPSGTPVLEGDEVPYLIQGRFGQNTGPNQQGYWKVRTYWSPGSQRWTFWDVFIYTSGKYGDGAGQFAAGNLIERFSSLNFDPATAGGSAAGDGVVNENGGIPNLNSPDSDYVGLIPRRINNNPLNALNPLAPNQDSGCFTSEAQKGNSIPRTDPYSTYYESGVYTGTAGASAGTNSTYCDAGRSVPAYLNSPSTGGGSSSTVDGYFAVVQDEPHVLYNGTNSNTVSHSYFRIPLLLEKGAAFGQIGSLNNRWILTGTNTQSQEWFGWSVTTLEITNGDPGLNGNTTATCQGGNSFPTGGSGTNGDPLPRWCPYSGNNQNNQGLAGGGSISNTTIPAPLPAAGIVPLGVALRKLSSRRRQLLAHRAAPAKA